ncbi:MAG: response regulator [Bdellovibrionia bacterium]
MKKKSMTATPVLETPPYRNHTLLIVDDDALLRGALAFDFKRKGFCVIAVESGKKALEVLKTTPVDLILADLRMSNGDGGYLLTQLKKRKEAHPPLILLSGLLELNPEEYIHQGALAVFEKPFCRRKLLKLILNTLEGSPCSEQRPQTQNQVLA